MGFASFLLFLEMVTGYIGRKIKMSQVFDEKGNVVPVTIVAADTCVVTQIKRKEKDGYLSVQIGSGNKKPSKLNKSLAGHLKGSKKKPAVLREILVSDEKEFEDLKVGQKIKLSEVFQLNDKVQVEGVTKGHGFMGVVKRHGFHGGPKTHGQSDRHRAPGSIGGGTTPGRVYKGKKMAGHMGNAVMTVKGLRIVKIDEKNNELWIKGAVPGYRGTLVLINKTN